MTRSTRPAFPSPRRLISLAGAALLAGTASAQQNNRQLDRPADEALDVLASPTTDRVRYDNHAVVRVAAQSVRQLMAAQAISAGLWSEAFRLDATDFLVETDRIDDLRALGLQVEVLIENAQTLIDNEWAAIQSVVRAERVGIVPQLRGAAFDESWFSVFRQNDEISTRLDELASDRPDLATASSFGQSLEGRDLRVIRITGPETEGNTLADRPEIVWNGCQHAREWANPMTVMYLAEALVRLYGVDPEITRLVDTVEFVIAPVVNPDGYVYSWSDNRFWRKNRRPHGAGEFGVDLNRNWPAGWGGEGSSGDVDSNVYRGPAPLSEPESLALSQLIAAQPDLVGHIDFHTYSQLILRPYGYTFDPMPPEDEALHAELGAAMQRAILDSGGVFYQNIPGNQLYIAAGILSDWSYEAAGAVSFTYELRPASPDPGFVLPPEEIIPTGREILAAMRVYAGSLTQPFRIDPVDTPTGTVDSGVPIPVAIEINELPRSFDQGTHDPATVTLSWDDASPSGPSAGSVTMTTATGTTYSADLPAVPCGSSLTYRVSASSVSGAPFGSADRTVEGNAVAVAFADTAQTDLGWTLGLPGDTAASGAWQRANPEPTSAQPGDDSDDQGGRCFITGAQAGAGAGTNDIDGGFTTLISPRLDATTPAGAAGDAALSYARWYSNDQGASPNDDVMVVSISNDDGNSWTTLEEVTENANRWVRVSFRVADFVEPTDAVRVRFVASDLGDGSLVEAGVDDVALVFEGCPDEPAPDPDWNGDGVVNILDVIAFVGDWNAQDPRTDLDDSGTVNVLDVLAFIELWNG